MEFSNEQKTGNHANESLSEIVIPDGSVMISAMMFTDMVFVVCCS